MPYDGSGVPVMDEFRKPPGVGARMQRCCSRRPCAVSPAARAMFAVGVRRRRGGRPRGAQA
ncbi:hypothetical protein LT493_10215 [Streptomyces tricolor]|nr:hypothetical protein [Streptomyces tricolor]